MYFKSILFATIMLLSLNIYAQDSLKINRWIPNAVVGLNISQIAFSNWTQGGENSMSWTFLANGGYNRIGTLWTFRNNLKLAYGRTKLGGNDFRTNDNEIYLENLVSRNISWAVDPYFSNTLRTAVSTGYAYDVTPAVQIADIFDPGYLTQSLGFVYDNTVGFNTRVGVAIQEVFTNRFVQYTDDLETEEIEKFKLETGIESVTNGEFAIAENMLAKSSLRLFSRFESLDVWDVRWDNIIAAKVNSFLSVNLNFLLIYEKQQSAKTQIKESLQLGFTYTLL